MAVLVVGEHDGAADDGGIAAHFAGEKACEALGVRARVFQYAAQRFEAAREAEGRVFRLEDARRARRRLRIMPEGIEDARRAGVGDETRIARERDGEACAPGFGVSRVDLGPRAFRLALFCNDSAGAGLKTRGPRRMIG